MLAASRAGSGGQRMQRCLLYHGAWLPDLEGICSSAPAVAEWTLRGGR